MKVLNDGDERLRVRILLIEWKANVIYLQETKLEFFFKKKTKSNSNSLKEERSATLVYMKCIGEP